MGLKIGVDARELENYPNGIGRVLFNLLQEWTRKGHRHRIFLYFKNSIPELECVRYPGIYPRHVRSPALLDRNRIWEQWVLPKQIRADELDVFFSPAYTLPLCTPCPGVVFVHDVSYQSHPEWFGWRDGFLMRWFTRKSIAKARTVLTCSEFTRREIIRHYGEACAAKIEVVPWAPDPAFKPAGEEERAPEFIADLKPYFLFVGTLFARRNIPLFVRAFRRLAERHPDCRLVLAGRTPEGEPDWRISAPGEESRIVQLEQVAEKDLPALYRNAHCLVHPSSYEGFGLPVIEAMACGTPVIISPADALREAAGDSARVAEPLDESSLVEAMMEMGEREEVRDKWRTLGLQRASGLTWEQTASQILQILEQSVSRRM